jgi:ABC-type multidrug transport system fused ATPase/permease subunit
MNADKIIVLDEGRLIEFDSPANLLQKEGSAFKGMVDGSGDKEMLYTLAGASL